MDVRNLFSESVIRDMTRIAIEYDAINLVLVDISDFGFVEDTAFCVWMAREIGVAAVPGSSFFQEPVNHLVRFHFAKREETLAAAGNRLLRLKEKG